MEIENNGFLSQNVNNDQIIYPEEVYEYIHEEIPGQRKEYGHFLIRRKNYQLYESGLRKTKGLLKAIKKKKINCIHRNLKNEWLEKPAMHKKNLSAKFLGPCKLKTFYTNYVQGRYSYANYDIPERRTKTRRIISKPFQQI